MVKLLKSVKENFLYWGVGFLLFFIPAYPKFHLFSVSGTYVSIRLEDVLVAILVFSFALFLILKRDFRILKWSITRLILLYFGIGLLSVISGIWITKNVVPHIAFLHFLRRVEYLSLFFVAYYSLKEKKQLRNYGWIILFAAFGIIIYGLGQKFFGWPVVSTMNKEFSKGMVLRLTWWARVNSTFAGHYDLAAFMVMILPMLTISLMIVKKWQVKILIFFLGILCYYMLLLTASRISFGAYLVSVLLVLFFSNKKWWIFPFLSFSILGMIFSDDLGQRYAATFKIDLSFMSGIVKVRPPTTAIAPTVTAFPTITPTEGPVPTRVPGAPAPTQTPTPTPTVAVATPSGEFEPTELAVGRSTDIRLKVEWPRAVRAFLKNPLLGTGFSSITLATDNDYLRMLGETGLLGSLTFLAIILELFRNIYIFLKKNKLFREEKLIVLGILFSGVGYFLNATFIDVLESSKIAFFFWILMGVALRIVNLSEEGKS